MTLSSWQGKTIYFVLTDRFYNGDKSNDDFGKGEFNPRSDDCFQGGDLKGISRKLPHIKSMGFDVLWLTPPVHNQWINPYLATRGYHGYWAYDFTKVDPHFGTLDDYKRMVRKAHALGLLVIQDIVVNHTGNFFTIAQKGYDPKYPEKNWKMCPGSYPPKAPNDPVFAMNNPNLPEHKQAAVYNFTPNISDFKSREQTLTYSMGDLDDINLHSPLAANRMKEIYRYWIDAVGIDGYRVDTVYYTPEDFYEGFLFDQDPANLGIKRFAAQKGKKEFFVFGEAWSYDYKAINRYLQDGPAVRLDSAIDLPLNEALTQVFYRKTATEGLRKVLSAKRRNPTLWVNFLDNHDVERVNGRASWAAVKQSLVALFTLPGIPCVYYGTEAGFKAPRQNMFRDAYYDETSRHFAWLKKLNRFRKSHPALSVGRCTVEKTSPSCGILAYAISLQAGHPHSPHDARHGGAPPHQDEEYLVVFNTSPDRMFYDLAGRVCKVLLSSGKERTAKGHLILGPDSFHVLQVKEKTARPRPGIRMRPLRPGVYDKPFNISYRPAGARKVYLLSNDNYDKRIELDGPGAIDPARLGNGRHTLGLLGVSGSSFSLSAGSVITIRNPYRPLGKVVLPSANKNGLKNNLHLPADPSYGRQCSLEAVALYSSGRDLRLRLKMADVTDAWNPPHGYDHVYFNILCDFPGVRGGKDFPKLDYRRKDFKFNAGFLLYGWGAQSYGTKGSRADAYGDPLIGEMSQAVDRRNKTITVTLSEKYFDSLKSFSGVKVFISTWDGYLGDFRALSDKKNDWAFYTVDGSSTQGIPRIFDYVIMEL